MSGDLEVLDTRTGTFHRWEPYGASWGSDLASEGYVRLEDASPEQLARAVPELLRHTAELEDRISKLERALGGGE